MRPQCRFCGVLGCMWVILGTLPYYSSVKRKNDSRTSGGGGLAGTTVQQAVKAAVQLAEAVGAAGEGSSLWQYV